MRWPRRCEPRAYRQGEPVLTNGFTLAPVPGSIVAASGMPVLVEITDDLIIDLDDLAAKISHSGARFLLLPKMRGHLADMDALTALLAEQSVMMIEDCAHTMGAAWNGRRSGSFGLAGCFSTQTYKHRNSGEGGFLTSDEPALIARATILSGSYMLYERHGAGPDSSASEQIRLETPNMSGRLDNLRAAILRPELATWETNIERWNERYRAVETWLRTVRSFHVPVRPAVERFVGSSIQFLIPRVSPASAEHFVADNRAMGVELKWFGAADPVAFTSIAAEPLFARTPHQARRDLRRCRSRRHAAAHRRHARHFRFRLDDTGRRRNGRRDARHRLHGADSLAVPANADRHPRHHDHRRDRLCVRHADALRRASRGALEGTHVSGRGQRRLSAPEWPCSVC